MKKIAIYLSVITTLVSNSALAGLFDDDEARRAILDMRTQISDSKKDQEQKYSQLQTAILSLQNQIETLQSQKNDTNGQFEIINNDLGKLKSSYEVLANSYTDKLNAQEQAINQLKQNNGYNTQTQPVDNSYSDNPQNTDAQENVKFNEALKYFSNGNFKKSAESFNVLLSNNSDVSLMPLIVYYLGSSYYALQKYKLANAQFLSFINNYPSHEKIPDVYLTLSSVYSETNDKMNAKKTLEYIVRNYPNNNAAILAQKRLQEFKK